MYECEVLSKYEPWINVLLGEMSEIEKIALTECTNCAVPSCATIACSSCGGTYKSSAPSYKKSSKALRLGDVI